MLVFMIEDQTRRAAADLRREPVARIAHDGSSFSGVEPSGKPRAVQIAIPRAFAAVIACAIALERLLRGHCRVPAQRSPDPGRGPSGAARQLLWPPQPLNWRNSANAGTDNETDAFSPPPRHHPSPLPSQDPACPHAGPCVSGCRTGTAPCPPLAPELPRRDTILLPVRPVRLRTVRGSGAL
jgi:hypothetical protein